MNDSAVWDELGIEPTDDVRAIKQAYATRLKQRRPDDDAAKFQSLRRAYEAAVRGDALQAGAQPIDTRPLSSAWRQSEAQPQSADAGSQVDISPLDFAPSLDIAPLILECRGLSPEAARQRLDAFVQTIGDDLDAGLRLETVFLRHFVADDRDEQVLIGAAIEKFGWEARDHPFQQECVYGLDTLIGRAHARAEVHSLLAIDRNQRWNPQRHVLAALRRPPQPWWFHVLAASPGHVAAAQMLLERWHARLPAMFEFELNQDSVCWWEIRLWEGGLTLPRVFTILGVSTFVCVVPIVGLLMLLNSGEPWALWIAIPGGILLTVVSVMGLRRFGYTMRRRLRLGPWREKYALWGRLRQDMRLSHWLRTATALTLIGSSLVEAPSLQGGVGCALFTLVALQAGLQRALLMALLAAPTAMALNAWAVSSNFTWQDRILPMWAVGILLVVAAFTAANRILVERSARHLRIRRVVFCALGLLLIYPPLWIWKSLAHP